VFYVCRLNERGLFDYLLLNDDLEATTAKLERVAEVSRTTSQHGNQPALACMTKQEWHQTVQDIVMCPDSCISWTCMSTAAKSAAVVPHALHSRPILLACGCGHQQHHAAGIAFNTLLTF
jgi:hypothetical protein